jgi:hypothetical protein
MLQVTVPSLCLFGVPVDRWQVSCVLDIEPKTALAGSGSVRVMLAACCPPVMV